MSNLKRLAADALASYLQTATGYHSMSGSVDWEQDLEFSGTAQPTQGSITVLPGKFTLDPYAAEDVDGTVVDHLLSEVGYWTGVTEIRVNSSDRETRESIEAAVTDALMSDPLRAGVLDISLPSVTIGGVAYPSYVPRASFEFTDSEWHDEMVFGGQRYSYLECNTSLPALASSAAIYDIDEYVTAIAASTDSAVLTDPAPAYEPLDIEPDGSARQWAVWITGGYTVVHGNALQLSAKAQDVMATASDPTQGIITNPAVTWSTSDPTIATVNSSTGLVTGVAAGSVTITATYLNGSLGTQAVTVT